jgi:hypothetical protein
MPAFCNTLPVAGFHAGCRLPIFDLTLKHMNFLTRLSNGWNIALNGISMLLLISSFFIFLLAAAGWDADAIKEQGTVVNYLLVFLYYLVNYFIVVFFNTALVHCTHLYFGGEKPTIGQGIRFSISRIGAIFSWAIFAATVGTLLRLLQDNLGWIGKIITGLIGIVWSVATFFVVPVIAYENVGPFGAFKRSAELMKEKWGEGLGATFSFGLIQVVGILLLAIPSVILSIYVHPLVGIILLIVGTFSILVVMSAVRMIFISAVYHDIKGNPVQHFNQQFADGLFVQK